MAKRIDVQCPDQSIYDHDFDRLYTYRALISLLSDVKLTRGPAAVMDTLRRHDLVSNFLLSFQTDTIIDLEGKIKLLGDVTNV